MTSYCQTFALNIIESNIVPKQCDSCIFSLNTFSYKCRCSLLKTTVELPRCKVLDFTKYLLEVV